MRETGSPEALPWLPNLADLIRPTHVVCYWVIWENVATGQGYTWLHTLIPYIALEHPNNNSNQLQTLMMTVGHCLHK